MKQRFEKRLAAITAVTDDVLCGGLKGVEKEALRVDADGLLSMKRHPASLGSALTNRYITTDFSESLLEFVTPAFVTTWEALQCLCDIHQFTYSQLDGELLWPASMPCLIPDNDDIPLAKYGSSNVGRMKTIYRRGLGYRYGRQMQLISGVHFNYSLPRDFWPVYQQHLGSDLDAEQFRSEHYLGLIRNFRRMGWLVLYLFGASPAFCRSFTSGAAGRMKSLEANTFFGPYATSLRMSDLGYSNQNQSKINISLNSLDEYVGDLKAAICTPEPEYKAIGVKVDGKYRQLNANLLQIENEFYSPVRPKRVAKTGERPTAALRRDGIEYVEIRSLDINPFDPSGINQNTMRFVEAMLIYCLLEDSPKLDAEALTEISLNHAGTAKRGRDPEFRLLRNGLPVTLQVWGSEILSNVLAVAEVIDRNDAQASYADSVRQMQKLVDDPGKTPSARMLADLEETQSSFFEYALTLANSHRDYFASVTPLEDARREVFEKEVAESLLRQEAIEAADNISLDQYLQLYFSDC
ncbi:MAG: glutamate--cysteine ligase [Gammaproteobacteria bacterium]|nr:glutamate--cysteine ligase [Gammaproteobacteria bacterium]MBT8111301.1 glutamate--cysteine ligase [Gammaproteobacteria bacterium]NND46060.1 glutamate--cysteine ligase [Woeseiaceae bacterium]NNL45999.1 glutamate--cysteine ligase [Woeseiaceae bacterium]